MQHTSDPKAANVNVPAQTPNGRLYLENSQQNVQDGLFVKILFDSISAGFTDGIEDVVNHRIFPGVAGWYQVNAYLLLESLIDACRYAIHVTRSGILVAHAEYLSPKTGTSTAYHISLGVSDVIKLTALQYLEVGIHHLDATEIVDVLGEETGSFLSVQRVR